MGKVIKFRKKPLLAFIKENDVISFEIDPKPHDYYYKTLGNMIRNWRNQGLRIKTIYVTKTEYEKYDLPY